MTAEPSASVWEVTRLILGSPDGSPSAIAHEHGYSAAEIAELMPIFLDTARTDWSAAADVGGWAAPGPGAAEHDAELYLRDLAGSGSIEAAGADGAPAPGAADGGLLTPDLGELLDGPARIPAVPADEPPGAPEPPAPEPATESPAPGPAANGTAADEAAAADGTGVPVDGAPGSTPADEPFALGDDDPFAGDPFAAGPFVDDAFDHPTDHATSPGFEIDDVAGGPYPG